MGTLFLRYCRVLSVEHDVDIHLVHLPKSARQENICLRWQSVAVLSSFTGCWALDNVLISSTAGLSSQLQDHFDPTDISNWLFYPGGRVEVSVESVACGYPDVTWA